MWGSYICIYRRNVSRQHLIEIHYYKRNGRTDIHSRIFGYNHHFVVNIRLSLEYKIIKTSSKIEFEKSMLSSSIARRSNTYDLYFIRTVCQILNRPYYKKVFYFADVIIDSSSRRCKTHPFNDIKIWLATAMGDVSDLELTLEHALL